MVTVLLMVAAVLVLFMLLAVCWQMTTSPFWWVYHLLCGTVGTLAHVLLLVLQGIWEGLTGAASS
jgi:hypothetical protein